MQTFAAWNYLNDSVLSLGFQAAGRVLTQKMKCAHKFIPELKNTHLTWAEWEPDFSAAADTYTTAWLTSHIGLILSKLADGGKLTNAAISKLMYKTTLLAAQASKVKSPLTDYVKSCFSGICIMNYCVLHYSDPVYYCHGSSDHPFV